MKRNKEMTALKKEWKGLNETHRVLRKARNDLLTEEVNRKIEQIKTLKQDLKSVWAEWDKLTGQIEAIRVEKDAVWSKVEKLKND